MPFPCLVVFSLLQVVLVPEFDPRWTLTQIFFLLTLFSLNERRKKQFNLLEYCNELLLYEIMGLIALQRKTLSTFTDACVNNNRSPDITDDDHTKHN